MKSKIKEPNLEVGKLLELADLIEAKAPTPLRGQVELGMGGFMIHDRGDYEYNKCGTAACIAGLAVLYFDPDFYEKAEAGYEFVSDPDEFKVNVRAREILGVRKEIADLLFYGKHKDGDDTIFFSDQSITSEVAVKTLRHLAETGEVRWDIDGGQK